MILAAALLLGACALSDKGGGFPEMTYGPADRLTWDPADG